MNNELLAYGLGTFTTFLSIMNPFSIMPVFLTMTANLELSARRATARKAVIVAVIAMILFGLLGRFIFDFFGLSVNSMRVVGGIIFFYVGQDMLNARLVGYKVNKSEVREYVDDIAITPLAIPMICGPGAITNSIVLMNETANIFEQLILVGAMLSIGLLIYLVLFTSERINKVLGKTGNKILMRIMGLIVMVVAVEYFVSGITPIVREMIDLPTK